MHEKTRFFSLTVIILNKLEVIFMYIGLQKIKDVIDYIEDNITADLDCKTLSLKMGLSVYEFRRIFSFVIGCPISEYIRKRR